MNPLRSARPTLKRIVKTLQKPRELKKLSRVSPSLARAIEQAYLNSLTKEERVLINRIEALRDELNHSQQEIIVIDYGAGSPDSQLSQAEMDRGKENIRKVGDICQIASKSPTWCLLLYKIIKEFKPSKALELGTCLGISSAYQAAALAPRVLTTLEGSDSIAAIARKNFIKLGLDVNLVEGRFKDTLAAQLPVDYAFVDGHHDEQATVSYFNQICAGKERCVLIFDDIAWSDGMRRAWQQISSDPRVRVAVDLHSVGICLVEEGEYRNYFKIQLE